ncbi:NRDE family protein [Pseudohaliea rubra]|uniref:NRDE family protein n=1 Tax=Pseudohaliea rubra DSM 19751 TaxID=1265313 RepID=A0A095VNV5_9GAMM|nr:NRDE family protein [Pseudohaliea rubra]KGE03050.1 hypothetical protein HRUBRA_02367 [Pseudohaliea rubra DSM 19751]
MCLVLLALGSRPDLPLIVAANRDEFHARPSAALHRWPGSTCLVAGRDLEAGGTWLGVDARGRFATVTNISETPAGGAFRSRGELVPGFLEGERDARTYAGTIDGDAYRAFNLLLWDGNVLLYHSNRFPARELGAGVHAVANGSLNEARFKVQRSRAGLEALLAGNKGFPEARLFDLLADCCLPEPPEERVVAGLSAAEAAALAAPFIVGERYGTRASTVVRVDAQTVTVAERRFAPGGAAAGSDRMVFGRG